MKFQLFSGFANIVTLIYIKSILGKLNDSFGKDVTISSKSLQFITKEIIN